LSVQPFTAHIAVMEVIHNYDIQITLVITHMIDVINFYDI